MFSVPKRLTFLIVLWLIVGFAFAFAPVAPGDYPEDRIGAFFSAPLMFAVGLILLLAPSETASAIAMVCVLLYLYAQVGFFLTQARRSPILLGCAVHLILTVFAVVGYVRFSWASIGG